MIMYWHLYMLLIILLPFLQVITSAIYYVAPEDHPPSISNDSHTVEEYLNNASQYFTSNTQLHFLPGYHYLQKDLIIQNIINFNISGTTDSIIVCNGTVPVGLAIVNVTRLIFQNISLRNCGKDYVLNLTSTHHKSVHNHSEFPPVHWNSALYLYNCTFVLINKLLIINDVSVNGLLLVNVRMVTKIANLTVKVNKLIADNKTFVNNGILIYYYDEQHQHNILNGSMDIQNFTYQCNSSNLTISQNALSVILTQLNFSVSVTVSDSSFHDLFNASILYYYGESCGIDIWNRILFNNCKIYNNTGKQVKQLFAIFFHNNGHMFSSIVNKPKCVKHYNIIKFDNCTFSNNSDIITLLYLIPINTVTSNAKLMISHCSFHKNYAVYLIKSRSKVQMLWQLSHYIVIEATNISSNFHKNGSGIISMTNGLLKLADIVKITNNSYYFGILDLYLSILKFNGSCIIVRNLARHILLGREGSYYLLKTNSTVKIMNNTVVSVLSYSTVYNRQLGEVCCFQFLNRRGHNLDNSIMRNEPLYYRIEMINNTYTAPTHLIKPFRNCSWLPDTAFQKADAGDVFSRIFKLTTIRIEKSKIGVIPSSICRCNSTIQYDCDSHQLGATYPGQTLTVKLIIPPLIYTSKSSIQLIANVDSERAPDEHCTIIETTEITQVRLDHGCNWYNFTVWSKKNECELYLSENQLSGIEIFYVTLLPCPIGFTLQSNARTCSCDSVLDGFATSCNLNDGTVQRSANSWIFGKTVDGSHTYYVSLNCPFDYC